MNKKVFLNIISLLGIQGIGYVIPLITLPYLVRTLHPHGYGLYSYSLAVIQYFILLVDFGFNLSITKKISKDRENKFEVSNIFWNTLSCKSILLLIGLIITVIWVNLDPLFMDDKKILISAFTIVFGNMIFPVWLFQGKEEMANIAISNISAKLIAVPAIFIFVNDKSDIWLACLINGITFIIAGIIGLYIVYRKKWIVWIRPSLKRMLLEFKNAWHIFISTASINIYTSSITVILGIMTNTTAVGYFVAADKIRLAIQGLIGPISQALYPRINSLMSNDRKKAFSTINLLLKIQGGGALLISVFLFLFSNEIITLLYGNSYAETVKVMKVLSWLPFLVAVSNVLGYQTLLVLNLEKILSRVVIIGAVSALVLIFPMIDLFGVLGAALTILLVELIVNQLMIGYILRKKIPIFSRGGNDKN